MTIELRAGGDRVELEPAAGGRLSSFVANGRQRLVTHPPAGQPADVADLQWGCYVMAPWAGRIRSGRLRWEGREHRLEQNLDGHAIHGVVHDGRWRVRGATDSRARLACDLDPARWPFGGTVEHEVELEPSVLRLVVTVRAAERRMPTWVGWHACFRRPDAGDVRVGVEAGEVLVTDEETIPTGELRPVSGDTDLRGAPALGRRRLDHAFPHPGEPIGIRWPDLDLEMTGTPEPACAVVFTPAHEFCVEPQTGWPDALRLAQEGHPSTGVSRLEAGGSLRARVTWTWAATRGRGAS